MKSGVCFFSRREGSSVWVGDHMGASAGSDRNVAYLRLVGVLDCGMAVSFAADGPRDNQRFPKKVVIVIGGESGVRGKLHVGVACVMRNAAWIVSVLGYSPFRGGLVGLEK